MAPAEADIIDVVALFDPSMLLPPRFNRTRQPTVIVVGDDTGKPDGCGGPGEWRCTPALRRWTSAVLVHGAAGEAYHYAEGVRMARKFGRLVFVETTSKHAEAWVKQLNCARTLLVVAAKPHPISGGEAAP
jgi:hypothetical protein